MQWKNIFNCFVSDIFLLLFLPRRWLIIQCFKIDIFITNWIFLHVKETHTKKAFLNWRLFEESKKTIQEMNKIYFSNRLSHFNRFLPLHNHMSNCFIPHIHIHLFYLLYGSLLSVCIRMPLCLCIEGIFFFTQFLT